MPVMATSSVLLVLSSKIHFNVISQPVLSELLKCIS
uniref:Uncharacterized protein n=1 Tax=Anguilla anguilla TaxID=7936 RepID=A0A0E9V528_ANGAN